MPFLFAIRGLSDAGVRFVICAGPFALACKSLIVNVLSHDIDRRIKSEIIRSVIEWHGTLRGERSCSGDQISKATR